MKISKYNPEYADDIFAAIIKDPDWDMFSNDIAIDSAFRFSCEWFGRFETDMRHGVGKIDEERRPFAVLDELDGFICVAPSQLAHVRKHFDERIIAKQMDPVVVA